MKLVGWALTVRWDDGTVYDVSHRVPMMLSNGIEQFLDFVEEQDSDDYMKQESTDE